MNILILWMECLGNGRPDSWGNSLLDQGNLDMLHDGILKIGALSSLDCYLFAIETCWSCGYEETSNTLCILLSIT